MSKVGKLGELLIRRYGEGNYFGLRKSLFEEVKKTKSTLHEHFHEMFNQLSFFQQYLNTQRGMAVNALQLSLDDHLEFLSKSAPAMLYFLDTTEAVLSTLESTDLGDTYVRQPSHRHQWSYTYSENQAGDQIDLSTFSLVAEAESLASNFTSISEILGNFTTTIDNVVLDSSIPWGNFSSIWREAHHICRNIIEETDEQLSSLIEKTDVLIEEMNRVDHYLAFSNLA